MNPNDLISKLQSYVLILRRGRKEQILASLAGGLFSLAVYLCPQWEMWKTWKTLNEVPFLAYVAAFLFGTSALCAICLFIRIWRQAVPPPAPLAALTSNAIKGLLPFTIADGALFAKLGRNIELQQLLAIVRNDQVRITVLRGQSGAGKTSLLQAGVAYALGEDCYYWEATPTKTHEALLHAIRSRFPTIESLDSLPEACPKRFVLILDQFEQLSISQPEHAPVFAMLERIAKAPGPQALSAIIGFRREYASDWLDFEQSVGFRAEQMPLNLLAPSTASDGLITLANEAGFTLEVALVDCFIAVIRRPEGVSPVDIAIGILCIANLAQQSGKTHLGMVDYKLAGGADGLLLSYVQQKLEEMPEPVRGPLIKGMVLTLVNLSNNQRIAGGASAAEIALKAGMTESSLLPLLERLTHPRMRLLEKTGIKSYRLPHERLVPVLRRLAGLALASIDKLKLTFESEFARWCDTNSPKNLLIGRDLSNVLKNRNLLIQGDTASAKNNYLKASLRRRNQTLGILFALAVISGTSAFFGIRWQNIHDQQVKLSGQALPIELFEEQHLLDSLTIWANDITWLTSSKIQTLSVNYPFASSTEYFNISPILGLKNLSKLELGAYINNNINLTDLTRLKKIRELNLWLNLAAARRWTGIAAAG